jgi:hypothetical protein
MARTPGADKVAINLRMPRDLHARLTRLAAGEGRSLNGQIVWLLEQATPEREAEQR